MGAVTAGPGRLRAALLALLAVPALALGAGAPPASAAAPAVESLGVSLVDAPASRRDDPRASLYVIDHVEPGTTIRRRVQVLSTMRTATEVQLYPAAADVQDGRFVGADGRTVNELASWIRISPSTLTVPAGGRAVAEVTLSVPSGAGGGERYGVIWAEQRAARGAGVTAVSRVGVRAYLSVGGPVEPASDFVVEELSAARQADGRPVVTAQVRNTGGRALDLQGSLRLTGGPGGTTAGPFAAQTGTTLGVGESAPVTVPLDAALPEGPWTMRLEMSSGELVRVVEGRLSLPRTGSDTVAPRDVTPEPGPGGHWYDQVLEVLAGLLVLALLLVLWRRTRRREEELDVAALPLPGPAPLPAPLPRPRRAPVRAPQNGAASASS